MKLAEEVTLVSGPGRLENLKRFNNDKYQKTNIGRFKKRQEELEKKR